MFVFGGVIALSVLTTGAFVCANAHEGINLRSFLRRTFVPLRSKEFWLPPCPFCWAARAVAVCLIIGFVLH